MNLFQRAKNIYKLSGMEQAATIDREVKLTVPRETELPKRKLAMIIEVDKQDMFKKDDSN